MTSDFYSYPQRSDTDVLLPDEPVRLLTTGGRHGHVCILRATLHTSNCKIHLFITSPICLFPTKPKGLTDVQPFCCW